MKNKKRNVIGIQKTINIIEQMKCLKGNEEWSVSCESRRHNFNG